MLDPLSLAIIVFGSVAIVAVTAFYMVYMYVSGQKTVKKLNGVIDEYLKK